MIKRHKDLLRAVVGEMRRTLAGTVSATGEIRRGDLDRELERIGIAMNGNVTPLDALPNPTANERRAYSVAVAQLSPLSQKDRPAARTEIAERAAYSWINRLLALRAMEARGLIDETLRNNPEYDGLSEALFVLRQTDPARTAGADAGWWAVLEDACAAQAQSLPGLFSLDDPNTALRPSTPALLKCIALVGGSPAGFTIEESDAALADPDAIGWAYQFYQEQAKALTYAKLGAGGKVSTRAEIAAATQLFTEPYMVKWLLQNSLGRSYQELFPNSKLPETWEYYIKPDKLEPPAYLGLGSLTVMDPCVGSGHFLREAFDMLAAMYREQHPDLSATQIADNILSKHLHGIDIDPRAAQLAALTLYLRSWEGVRDERRSQRKPVPGTYRPPVMNIATTPTGLDAGSLERHLRRHPQDRVLKPLLEGIFSALEQADILGSLLRPGEHLDTAIAALQKPHTIQMDFDADDAALRGTIRELARHNPVDLKRMLLGRVANSFVAEGGNTNDVAVALFGHEAEQGVRLLQFLDRQYAVVVTNPPYMGNGNMDVQLKEYVNLHYPSGKRDLYAAFVLRSLELCKANGRLAMVTQQTWMFLRSFADLRAVPDSKLLSIKKKGVFQGLLREVSIDALAHLGEYAFEDATAAGAFVVMFTATKSAPHSEHSMVAYRLIGLKNTLDKALVLMGAANDVTALRTVTQPSMLLAVPDSPLTYWLSENMLRLLSSSERFSSYAFMSKGLGSCDDQRFVRHMWEVGNFARWLGLSKGGEYKKWSGLNYYSVEYEHNGVRITKDLDRKFPYLKGNFGLLIHDPEWYSSLGLVYSEVARGSLGVRIKSPGQVVGHRGPGIYPLVQESIYDLAATLNSRTVSFLYRTVSSTLLLDVNYLGGLPARLSQDEYLGMSASTCHQLALQEDQCNPIERDFVPSEARVPLSEQAATATIRLALEGILEHKVADAYDLTQEDKRDIMSETGTPVAWLPLVRGYHIFPNLLVRVSFTNLAHHVADCLEIHPYLTLNSTELARLKTYLQSMYEAGPGAKISEYEPDPASEFETQSENRSGALIPIPTETFLEELSHNLQIHPISVYWLLEELRAEGVRCKPEELRMLEDHLSVLVLRLLGHRWPKQIEAGEDVPHWADRDGIIPITTGTGELTLAERLRDRLRAEEGELGTQQTEALLNELAGTGLEEWLRKHFFARHVRQFKYRPIAWHLASAPQAAGKKGGGRRTPAFECMLYYHACGGDVLARIRTQYVQPLLQAEKRRAEDAHRVQDETTAAIATARMHELEEFAERLRQVEEQGFACPDLDKLMQDEPLDRWSGDGYIPPSSRDELLHNERAWRVDINDGVRVNIAPLQLAGVLVSDVLKAPDAKKAIADRARWRSDERRWVREGKLPRCGWMSEGVPESPRWTELAPQREAERLKLEQKRKAVMEKLGTANE
jgi:hypothetical protein